MKGFLGGVSFGALVAVAGTAMWSLSAPLPARIQVDVSTPDQGENPIADVTEAPLAEERRDPDLVEAAPSSPEANRDEDSSPVAILDTDPGSRPVIATADGANEGDISQGAEVAVLPNVADTVTAESGNGQALNIPGQEELLEISTQTAALPTPPSPAENTSQPELSLETPDTPGADAGEGDVQETGQVAAPATVTAEIAPLISVDAPVLSAPQIGNAPLATALPNIGGIVQHQPLVMETNPEGDPVVPVATNSAQAGADEETHQSVGLPAISSAQPESQDQSEPDDQSQKQGEETTAIQVASVGARIGTPVVPLTERSSTPTLIANSETTSTATFEQIGIPFEINAEPFDVIGDRPLMSIVLIDDAAAIGAEALAEFPYPLSFAISPDDPQAVEKMQARRAAGFEVLILADLPREAAPQDAETTMAVWMKQLPQAVGFLEGVETGFQGNRPLADQMVTVMKEAGYGMVTQNSGLNTVQKLAKRDGMPSGVVFRDFDGAGQNPRAIRRFLDQAAFRARQEGAVIMLGRLRPDTISALLLWGLQDRANQVGLAPISAGLKNVLEE